MRSNTKTILSGNISLQIFEPHIFSRRLPLLSSPPPISPLEKRRWSSHEVQLISIASLVVFSYFCALFIK